MDPMTPHYRSLLEGLTTSVLLLDESLRLIFMNPAGEMLFEHSARRTTGRSIHDLIPLDEGLRTGLLESLKTGRPFTERERRLTLSPDRSITADLTVTPLIEAGRQRRLLVEMVQVDRQLQITREEHLLSQQAATRALLRGLAHEIKNPLGGLRGAAQLLERELPTPALCEYTRVIIGEADRLQNLVDRMLGPNSLPRIDTLNLHEVLEHIRSLVGAEAPPGVRLFTDYDPSIPDIRADRDLLIQAVLNIVRNALQAVGEKGCITLVSRVLRQHTIGQVRHRLVAAIRVVDDGPGIPPEMIERIFYPMVSGRAGGTGLGLSIAQSLINQHGGLIECASRPGQTVFTLLIPLESAPDA